MKVGNWEREMWSLKVRTSYVNVLCSLSAPCCLKKGSRRKTLGHWPAAVETCWQALIPFISIPKQLLHLSTARINIPMIFFISAQSSKLLYMQDRISFSPTLNKLLNNKIEYFCFVVSRARCLLASPNLVLVQRRKWQPKMKTKRKRKANSSGSREKSMGMITSRIIIIMSVVCCLLTKWRLRIVWRESSAISSSVLYCLQFAM